MPPARALSAEIEALERSLQRRKTLVAARAAVCRRLLARRLVSAPVLAGAAGAGFALGWLRPRVVVAGPGAPARPRGLHPVAGMLIGTMVKHLPGLLMTWADSMTPHRRP